MTGTLIFAHRGANREAAENTRSAFDKALEYPIDGIETDVQLSRDEVAVLWHDRFLGKVGFPLKHIDDFDHARLQTMNFAAHFSSRSEPEGIVSLKEFLGNYRMRCRLLLEIKNRDWESVSRHQIKVKKVLDMVREFDDTDNGDVIMASSFNLDSLVYAQQYRPGFPLVYNFETDQTHADAQRVLAEQSFLHGLCLPIKLLDQVMVKLLRGHGKLIAVYTCNSDTEINKALDMGVDILISDVPQKALQVRAARGE
jgi:glycerophosphoryl diester phosphodiesterase